MKIIYSNGRKIYVLDDDGTTIGVVDQIGVLNVAPIRAVGRQLVGHWFASLDWMRRYIPLWNEEPFRLVSRPHKFDRVVQL